MSKRRDRPRRWVHPEPVHEDTGRTGACKSSCCKTPYGVCARQGKCGCHVPVKKENGLDQLLEGET